MFKKYDVVFLQRGLNVLARTGSFDVNTVITRRTEVWMLSAVYLPTSCKKSQLHQPSGAHTINLFKGPGDLHLIRLFYTKVNTC